MWLQSRLFVRLFNIFTLLVHTRVCHNRDYTIIYTNSSNIQKRIVQICSQIWEITYIQVLLTFNKLDDAMFLQLIASRNLARQVLQLAQDEVMGTLTAHTHTDRGIHTLILYCSNSSVITLWKYYTSLYPRLSLVFDWFTIVFPG